MADETMVVDATPALGTVANTVETADTPEAKKELTPEEVKRLAELEGIVRQGKAVYIEVGKALRAINKEELYEPAVRTFDKYCETTFGFGRHSGYDYIHAVTVAEMLSDVETTRHMSFSQAVKLWKLNEKPEDLVRVAESTDFVATTVKALAEKVAMHIKKPATKTSAKKPDGYFLDLVSTAKGELNRAVKVLEMNPDISAKKNHKAVEELVALLQESLAVYTEYLETVKKKKAA